MNNYSTQPLQARRPLALDGVQRAPAPRDVPAGTPAQLPRTLPARRVYSKPVAARKERKFWEKLQLPLLIMAGAAGGFFADNLALGLSLLAIYGITAFVTRVASRTTFTLALLLLGAISMLLLFKPNTQLIRNFATYAFGLLIVGAITLGREARLPKRARRKYRR